MAGQNAGSFFLEEVANAVRVMHYSIRTEEAHMG